MNHTPTPWAVGRSLDGLPCVDAPTESSCTLEICTVWGTEKDMIVNDECGANAAFIVRACNSHEALVEACQELLQELVDRGIVLPANDRARAALKLAGE